MVKFIYGTELNLELEKLILNADKYLWFISPYIKLHDRIKDELKRKLQTNKLHIVFVFGKNENDLSKSLSLDDINFLKQFPNVEIRYEKNLHAKFYASEDCSIITSMNLHQFSQNTNVEAGVILYPKSAVKVLADMATNAPDAGEEAYEYFSDVIRHSELIFKKTPKYKKTLLGLLSEYEESIIEVDNIASVLKELKPHPTQETRDAKPYHQSQSNYSTKLTYNNNLKEYYGFCIRTGVSIPYNPKKPMCYNAFKTWSEFGNADYPEKYCHFSGEPSNGETSVSKPILKKNWNAAK